MSLEQRMEERGFVTVAKAAKMAGRATSTIYRWLDDEQIEGEERAGKRFVNRDSLVEFVGEDMIEEVA